MMLEAAAKAHLFEIVSRYSAWSKLSPATVCRRSCVNDAKFCKKILPNSKAGLTLKTYDAVVTDFAGRWPEGVAWPMLGRFTLPRPKLSPAVLTEAPKPIEAGETHPDDAFEGSPMVEAFADYDEPEILRESGVMGASPAFEDEGLEESGSGPIVFESAGVVVISAPNTIEGAEPFRWEF
jgi:hypothetical protein